MSIPAQSLSSSIKLTLSTHATEAGHVLSAFTAFVRANDSVPTFARNLNYVFAIKEESKKNVRVVLNEFVQFLIDDHGFKVNYNNENWAEGIFNRYKLILLNESSGTIASFNSYKYGNSTEVDVELYSDDEDDIDDIHKLLASRAEPLVAKKEDDKSYINFICRNADGYYTHEFEVSNGIDFTQIYDNYEDDFADKFSNIVLEKLTSETYNKGIVLLHGAPGTGKTTYLRFLLSQIKEKKVMYLPPEMGHSLSDPGFITFLMSNPNSILVIEDAENIIKSREGGGSQAVSNILNLTDGILGSALRYQVVCTFNAEFTEIDAALTRKGRMIGEYEFKALSEGKTAYLIQKLYGENVIPPEKSMTLAAIHAMEEEMPVSIKEKRSIGFT